MFSFEEIWKKNRHIFEFVGIICGVGALFLAIPAPSNPAASAALLQIQFIWLFFIGLAVITLLINFGIFVSEAQNTMEKKHGIKFYIFGSPTYAIGILLILFCWSLWNYAAALYVQPLHKFLALIGCMFCGILIFVGEFLLKKYGGGWKDVYRILVHAAMLAILGSIAQILGGFALGWYELSFDGKNFWITQSLLILVIFFTSVLLLLGQSRRQRIQTTDKPITP